MRALVQYLKRMARLTLMVMLAPFMFATVVLVGLVFLVPLSIGLCALIWIEENRFTIMMFRRKRYVPWFRLGSLQPGDRLILESPTIGWATTRVWYVPAAIIARCPYTAPATQADIDAYNNDVDTFPVHPFVEWIYDHCLSEETGAGILVRAWNGRTIVKRLLRRHPELGVIEVWSAPVPFRRSQKDAPDNNSA